MSTLTPRLGAVLLSVCSFHVVLAGQTAPVFEVASIKPSPDGLPTTPAGVQITRRQFHATYLSLRDYVGIAFRLQPRQIVAPEWAASTRFDINATLPEAAQGDQLPQMLQAMLAERFQLRTHREQREFDVYALETANSGPPLIRVPDEAPPQGAFTATSSTNGNTIAADLGNGASLSFADNRFEAKRVTLAAFADTLGRFLDRPIIDMTNLEGRYNLAFDVAADDYYPMLIRSAVNAGIALPPDALRLLDAPTTGSVPDALKKIGLSLNRRRAPLDVLVIDALRRVPTDN